MQQPVYKRHSLRALRRELRHLESTYSQRTSRFWAHLRDVFALIDQGDDAAGLPAYNGGLFDPRRHPLLSRVTVADAYLAPVLHAFSYADDRYLNPIDSHSLTNFYVKYPQ